MHSESKYSFRGRPQISSVSDLASNAQRPPAFGDVSAGSTSMSKFGHHRINLCSRSRKALELLLNPGHDKLSHLTIDKLKTLFLYRGPIVRQTLIPGISSSPLAPLKTAPWRGDAIICFLTPPPEPYIMCANKAPQQQISICFLYLSSSSQQGQGCECVFPPGCFPQAGKEPLSLPGPAASGVKVWLSSRTQGVPSGKEGFLVTALSHRSLNHTSVLPG